MLAGEVDFRFSSVLSGIVHIRTGRMRPLAVTTAKRSFLLPDLPPLSAFYPGTECDQWYAMFRRAVDDHRPDREALLALVSAMQQSSYPGFMGNSTTFPEVLAPDNVEHVSMALVRELGLDQAKVA